MPDTSPSAKSNPSIVDFLKSQGLESSTDRRAEYYARFVDEKETYVRDARQNLALLRAMMGKRDLLQDIIAEQRSGKPTKDEPKKGIAISTLPAPDHSVAQDQAPVSELVREPTPTVVSQAANTVVKTEEPSSAPTMASGYAEWIMRGSRAQTPEPTAYSPTPASDTAPIATRGDAAVLQASDVPSVSHVWPARPPVTGVRLSARGIPVPARVEPVYEPVSMVTPKPRVEIEPVREPVSMVTPKPRVEIEPVREPVSMVTPKPQPRVSVPETRHDRQADRAPESLSNAGEALLAAARSYEGHPFDTLATPNADGTYNLLDGAGRGIWRRRGKVTLYDKGASWGNEAAGKPGMAVVFESDVEPIVCIDLLVLAAQEAGLMPRGALSSADERRVHRVEPYLQSRTDKFETIRVSGASYENVVSGAFKFPPLRAGDMIFLDKGRGHRHSGIVSEVDADGQPTKIYYVNSENRTGDFSLLATVAPEESPFSHVPGSGFMFPGNRVTSIIRPRSIGASPIA